MDTGKADEGLQRGYLEDEHTGSHAEEAFFTQCLPHYDPTLKYTVTWYIPLSYPLHVKNSGWYTSLTLRFTCLKLGFGAVPLGEDLGFSAADDGVHRGYETKWV